MMPEDTKTSNDSKAESSTTEEKQQESTSTKSKQTNNDGPSIFNVKKPKDIRDGFANGVGNIAKGKFEFLLTINITNFNFFLS